MLFKDYDNCLEITNSHKKENYYRFIPGNIRLSLGMYRTTLEENIYRKISLQRKLP